MTSKKAKPAKTKKTHHSSAPEQTSSVESASSSQTTSAAVTKNHSKHLKIGLSVTGVVLFIVALLLGSYTYFLKQYENKFYPGVSVGSVALAGLTYEEALTQMESQFDALEKDGVIVRYEQKDPEITDNADTDGYPTLHITPVTVPLDADGVDREVYSIDFEKSLTAAYQIGREGTILDKAQQQWDAWQHEKAMQLYYTLDHSYVTQVLQDTFSKYETPAQNADITVTETGDIDTIDEQEGVAFRYDLIAQDVQNHITDLSTEPITITLETDYPDVTAKDIEDNMEKIESYLSKAPLTMKWEDKQWEFDRPTVGSWMSFKSGELAVSNEKIEASLEDVKSDVEEDVQEARWKVEKDDAGNFSGITELQPAQDGKKIQVEETSKRIYEWLIDENTDSEDSVELAVEVAKPKFNADNIGDTGVKDLLGTGHSNMGGSPYNRRQNVARGVELLNGLLVAPGEEFSLLNALKPFTLENGYVSELVILGNKTTPEIGGGLCQVGTTTFRAAMNSGLDITERRNHSYAVSYYSDDRNHQPGTDATIYDPAPDFKFLNDTDGYILLQTRIEGNDLYFDFWGASDGRKGSFTPPTTSNVVAPPPMKEIPTTELAPGQRRCTESAHAGITAEFVYNIEYADGNKHEETFKSVYKPWQAVCQVGAPKEEPKPAETPPPADDAAKEEEQKKDDDKKN